MTIFYIKALTRALFFKKTKLLIGVAWLIVSPNYLIYISNFPQIDTTALSVSYQNCNYSIEI